MPSVGVKKALSNPESQLDVHTALLAQKTALISELAEATANQFNNTMMAISSYAELQLKKAAAPERRSLEQVLGHAARATSLIQKLLVLSRRHVPAVQPVQLNNVITEINDLLSSLMGEHIEVVVSLDPDVQRVNADYVELEQLLLSIALSARDAMVSEGSLALSTKLVTLDKDSLGGSQDLSPGKYVMLSVDGIGAGQGTDLEPRPASDQNSKVLAAIQELTKKAEALVQISTRPGDGASFTVCFPALGAEAPKPQDQGASTKGTLAAKTILVVEDDDAVRVPAAEFLKMEGFKVLQAKTGLEAIHVALRNRSPIDLLITDIVMPEMNGREVAGKLHEMQPSLKVLYMSGDADKTAVCAGTEGSQDAVLQKPFRLNKLNDKIRDLLER